MTDLLIAMTAFFLCVMVLAGIFVASSIQTTIVLDRKDWECTSAHVSHHPGQSGTLTRFGRLSDDSAWDENVCDSYSAIRAKPTRPTVQETK